MRVLILGCGRLGNQLGKILVQAGHQVVGVRRQAHEITEGISPLAWDLNDPAPVLPEIDQLVYCLAADQGTPSAYQQAYVAGSQQVIRALKTQGLTPKHSWFVSSTAVYGQTQGEWVDENSPTEPAEFRGQTLLQAEACWAEAGWPHSQLRLSGIYGEGSGQLLQRVAEGRLTGAEPPSYSNRIHREDAARALAHLMDLAETGTALDSIYLITDRDPAPMHQVTHWIATQLGVDQSTFTTSTAGARGGNKRCCSDRLAATGFVWRYPDYQAGYSPLIKAFQRV